MTERRAGRGRFPIVRRPRGNPVRPVLISIPHYGTEPLPGVTEASYADPAFATFPIGYTDRYAAELYSDMHRFGATVLATPYSRLFVDVNRRRDDFETESAVVGSRNGVVRTHTVRDEPVFAAPLTERALERRLSRYYDPYHEHLRGLLDELRARHRSVLLVDAHTAGERGLGRHEVVISTSRGRTASARVADRVEALFAREGFRTARDVKGYAGGFIVRHYGREAHPDVEAVQIEVNTGLLMTVSREELIRGIERGDPPRMDEDVARRLRRCVAEIVHDF